MPLSINPEPCIVYINVSILAFPAISTKDVRFTADFYLNLRWHDLRLNFWDLDHDYVKNRLSEEELDTIWMPRIAFTNSFGKLLHVDKLSGTLIREKEALIEDISLDTEGKKDDIIFHLKSKFFLLFLQHIFFLVKTIQSIQAEDSFKNLLAILT